MTDAGTAVQIASGVLTISVGAAVGLWTQRQVKQMQQRQLMAQEKKDDKESELREEAQDEAFRTQTMSDMRTEIERQKTMREDDRREFTERIGKLEGQVRELQGTLRQERDFNGDLRRKLNVKERNERTLVRSHAEHDIPLPALLPDPS